MYVPVFWVLFEDDFFFIVLPAVEAGAVAEPTPNAEWKPPECERANRAWLHFVVLKQPLQNLLRCLFMSLLHFE